MLNLEKNWGRIMERTDLLRKLGWSDELIEEVTRVSEDIRETDKKLTEIHESSIYSTSQTGNSLFFDAPNINTSVQLKAKESK